MSDETPVPGELAIGDHLAGYRLDEIVARGGMAVVYRAFDERLGRSVALKVLAAPLARDEAFRRRFIRESRAAAKLLSDPAHALLARVAVGQRPLGLVLVNRGAQLIVADSDRDNAPGRGANLAVIDVQWALHRQSAFTGFLHTGGTPRQFALEWGGGRLLVVDTGSGQVQAVKIGHLT